MRLTGTLTTWNDDRGFGFIAPKGGGARELFVHISALPQDGSRPTAGETLTYELGRGKDGKPQAVNVYRQALGDPSTYPRARARGAAGEKSLLGSVIVLILVAALGFAGYYKYQDYSHKSQDAARRKSLQNTAPPVQMDLPAVPAPVLPSASAYRCDGRTMCSQMTSCAEATYFINNCPGTKMDGDHDGIPCEEQFCRR